MFVCNCRILELQRRDLQTPRGKDNCSARNEIRNSSMNTQWAHEYGDKEKEQECTGQKWEDKLRMLLRNVMFVSSNKNSIQNGMIFPSHHWESMASHFYSLLHMEWRSLCSSCCLLQQIFFSFQLKRLHSTAATTVIQNVQAT